MRPHPGPLAPPSPLLRERLTALRDAARLGPVLDLACGRGRHALACARELGDRLGRLVAVDLDPEALAGLREAARAEGLARRLQPVRADLESGAALPLRAGAFGAVLVFRYLHRPLAPRIAALLRPGGLLLYETFTTAQRELGWGPRRPAFLLAPGELPTLFPELTVVSFEEGRFGDGAPEALARLVAVRPR